MATDKRNADARGESSSAADRRKKTDRRDVAGRREVDADSKPSRASSSESAVSRKTASGKKSRGGFSLLVKKLALAFIVIVVLFTVGLVYFFANLNYFMDQVGKRVEISVDRALLDPQSLTDRITRARLNFRVKNTLPLGVVFQNLHFNVGISEYTVAKGMQASPKIHIEGSRETIVPVLCSVDSIVTRRALQKTIERNAGPLLKGLLNRAQGKADTFGDDIKALVKVTGTAEFRLKAGGVEIPFTRKLDF